MTHASEARKTPEQKEAEAARKEELARVQEKTQGAVRRAFASADGRIALKAIMDRCCYQRPIVVHTERGYDSRATTHNAALHGHYLWLRKQVDLDTLTAVEVRGITESILD